MNTHDAEHSGAIIASLGGNFAALSCVMIYSELECQIRGKCMSTLTSDPRALPAGEPRPVISPLASFYWHARDLGWLVVRLTAGGKVLGPRLMKKITLAGGGVSATPTGLFP